MSENVHLTVVSSEAEAEVCCGLLRSEAIPCFHRPTDLSAEGPGFGGSDWREILPYCPGCAERELGPT